MKPTLVYVQGAHAMPASDTFYRAYDGFRKRGVRCELFSPDELRAGKLALRADTPVVGGVPVVEDALRMLGVPVPEADNLPERLHGYLGRRVSTSTWGDLRLKYGESGPPEPMWVKSLRRNKASPSIAVYTADDIESAARMPDDHEVLVSEYVVFVSEWRCFVRHGRILDICRYHGDWFRYPDAPTVRGAVMFMGETAPAGYAIDFGVLTDGRTVLVEVNDGYSLAPYGLESTEYAELLEARWVQMMG